MGMRQANAMNSPLERPSWSARFAKWALALLEKEGTCCEAVASSEKRREEDGEENALSGGGTIRLVPALCSPFPIYAPPLPHSASLRHHVIRLGVTHHRRRHSSRLRATLQLCNTYTATSSLLRSRTNALFCLSML